MIWLDFFLQVFVHALAWSLAIALCLPVAVTLLRLALGFPARPRVWRRGR